VLITLAFGIQHPVNCPQKNVEKTYEPSLLFPDGYRLQLPPAPSDNVKSNEAMDRILTYVDQNSDY